MTLRPALALVSLVSCLTVACTGAPAVAPASDGWPAGPLVDLSHTYGADTIFWPTAEPFALEPVAGGMTAQGYYYAANNIRLAEHGGTHLDAPIHFAEGRQTSDTIPVDRFAGPAVVLDVTAATAVDVDHLVPVAAFEAWERKHGRLPDGAIVLLRTGFSTRWPDAARYLGTAERGAAAVPKLHFPGLHPDAARWLVANRSVRAVGIDTASIDRGQSSLFETHRVLCERNVLIFENLTALDQLPATGAHVVALPMKITGGSGGPLRAVAFLPSR